MSGTGMLNDPERLRELEEQRLHSELYARLPPKKSFGQVLNAPGKVEARSRRSRPKSDEKLRPSAQHPSQGVAGFADVKDEIDELLEDGEKKKIVLKA